MISLAQLETARLHLRPWARADRDPFAALNADRRVMEFLPGVLSHAESDALIDRIEAHFSTYGFGLWAVEVCDGGGFAGFVGLSIPRHAFAFSPCVEVGWRLAYPYWGQGYATEAAVAALSFGFSDRGFGEIVSFTVADNWRSRRVMERIGMVHDASDDFDHPLFRAGHRLRRHVLYRKAGC
jgi:RimJ/RimL family protein N-acetyltransferase